MERTRYSPCPYCNKKRVSSEYNLQVIRPFLAKQWHPKLNGELTPKDIMPNSNKAAWWICENGHAIQKASNAIKKNDIIECDKCKSIDFLYPELAKEWHPTKNRELTPDNVSYGVQKRIWWQCKEGHEWESIVGNRVKMYQKRMGEMPCL